MELKHLNKDEFEQAVNAGDELVVVDFFVFCSIDYRIPHFVLVLCDKNHRTFIL